MQTTDRGQTDGLQHSEREREFTFAKNERSHVLGMVCLYCSRTVDWIVSLSISVFVSGFLFLIMVAL